MHEYMCPHTCDAQREYWYKSANTDSHYWYKSTYLCMSICAPIPVQAHHNRAHIYMPYTTYIYINIHAYICGIYVCLIYKYTYTIYTYKYTYI